MAKLVIYKIESGGFGILYGADGSDLPIDEVARKDCPAGSPFVIVDEEELPSSSYYADAWSVNFDEPDGYGVGVDRWLLEHEAAMRGVEPQRLEDPVPEMPEE